MSRPSRTEPCQKRLDFHLQERLSDLRQLWDSLSAGDEQAHERICEYGLCFDFVVPDTFRDQPEAYFRYQLSWGGPSDEFRFFVNPDFSCHRIEYWFLDWFDGASATLSGDAAQLLADVWDWFSDGGAVVAAYQRVA